MVDFKRVHIEHLELRDIIISSNGVRADIIDIDLDDFQRQMKLSIGNACTEAWCSDFDLLMWGFTSDGFHYNVLS